MINPDPRSPFILHQSLEDRGDELHLTTVVDSAPLDRQNRVEREQTNGWTPGRTMRKLASIPIDIYTRLPPEIREDPNALKDWIRKNPELCTADRFTF